MLRTIWHKLTLKDLQLQLESQRFKHAMELQRYRLYLQQRRMLSHQMLAGAALSKAQREIARSVALRRSRLQEQMIEQQFLGPGSLKIRPLRSCGTPAP